MKDSNAAEKERKELNKKLLKEELKRESEKPKKIDVVELVIDIVCITIGGMLSDVINRCFIIGRLDGFVGWLVEFLIFCLLVTVLLYLDRILSKNITKHIQKNKN
jgi:hypothetical protein